MEGDGEFDGNITRTDGPEIIFFRREIACKRTGVVRLHPGFAEALASLRMTFAQPMQVSSCCRSAEYNEEVGGHEKSLHVYDLSAHGAMGTLAIDIRRKDGSYAHKLVWVALKTGWSVGVARTFIHLDRRDFVGLRASVFGYG